MSTFRRELATLLNKHSKENNSNTPDYILADYLIGCLKTFDRTIELRNTHFTLPANDIKKQDDLLETEAQSIADGINYHNACAKATLGEVPKITKDDILSITEITNEYVKHKILLTSDYINKEFEKKPYVNNKETRDWVINKFSFVLRTFNIEKYIKAIKCDEENNFPQIIDDNHLVVEIYYSVNTDAIEYEKLYLTYSQNK